MINVVDPTELSEEDRLAIQQQKKTIYQVCRLYLHYRIDAN
jgi:hypothetical protein